MTTDTPTISPDVAANPSNDSWFDRHQPDMRRLGRNLHELLLHAVLQVRVLRKAYPGIMHGLIFWGMTIQIVGTVINLLQMQLFVPFVELSFPRGNAYLAYELIMDLAGVAIVAGALMALYRRIVVRPPTLESRWDDYYALIMLLIIPTLGFTLEGLRMVATSPPWARWSPVGNLVAEAMRGTDITAEAAWSAHSTLWWTHMVAGLILIASIPFTKLRHLITAPLNIVRRPNQQANVIPPIENIDDAEILGVGQIGEFTSQQLLSFDACVRCGRCEESCPVALSGIPFSPRTFIQSLRGVMTDTLIAGNGHNGSGEAPTLTETLGEEAAWYCTTCGACQSQCPVFVNPVSEVIDLRRYQTLTTGDIPGSIGAVLRNIERQGNPWGLVEDRSTWLADMGVRILEPGAHADTLFFIGCALSFDERNKKFTRAFVELMQRNGVDFAILGDAEICCGETARRLGHEYIFQVMAQQNIETMAEYTFDRIVTQCPHCYNTLKHEYPQFGGDYRVQHYTEFLTELAPSASTQRASNGHRITYHDSCYLGRYNNIYDAPRTLLDRAGPGQIEMPRARQNSFCCGGGGGQMWMETDAETRINNARLADVQAAGAEVVATACPYCLLMFDDAIRSQGLGEEITVMDIAELLTGQFDKRPSAGP